MRETAGGIPGNPISGFGRAELAQMLGEGVQQLAVDAVVPAGAPEFQIQQPGVVHVVQVAGYGTHQRLFVAHGGDDFLGGHRFLSQGIEHVHPHGAGEQPQRLQLPFGKMLGFAGQNLGGGAQLQIKLVSIHINSEM